MTKTKNQKTIEEKIEREIRSVFTFGMWHDVPSGYERVVEGLSKRLVGCLSDIIREIVGEDIDIMRFNTPPQDTERTFWAIGRNFEKQEIRERAKKLGLRV